MYSYSIETIDNQASQGSDVDQLRPRRCNPSVSQGFERQML